MAVTEPPPLRPGSAVAVVAPASPFDRDTLFRGLAWLRTRYRIAVTPRIFERQGFLAGSDARRLEELSRAMTTPGIDAILCARGGYGITRIVDRLPWVDFAARPKWIVGFSDVTALHASAWHHGVASIHGPNVTGIGRSMTPHERISLLCALEDRRLDPWASLVRIHPGAAACGVVVGGNLALLNEMASAGRLWIPEGSIVLLEDVTERPYRIDRMLTSLRLGGHLGRAAAIVFGGFERCEPGPDGITVEDVVAERTADLGIPVVAGAPFGHGAPNHAFVLGRRAVLDGTRLSF